MIVHQANVRDYDGASALLESARGFVPWLPHAFADGGYAGDKFAQGECTVEIVKRSCTPKEFVLLPRRWVEERTLAWLNRNQRLTKDGERRSRGR